MSRDWAPGDVAMVELPLGGERAGVLVDEDGDRCWHVGSRNGAGLLCLAADAVAVRPLVVIDPEDREQVERLAHVYFGYHDSGSVDDMQVALREFADPKPPKPAEPTGLGAVVEDDRGVRWVRVEPKNGVTNPWQATLHVAEPDTVRSLRWSAIDAVKVLSEGVAS